MEMGGQVPQGGAPPTRSGAVARAARRSPRPGPSMPYLRGSCRAGRRGSARIPGLIVLPLSPYPSIQLGLFPLASPWKKSSEEKQKINHAAQPRWPSRRRREQRAGRLGSPRPRAPGAPPPRAPRPRHPSPGPLQCPPGPAARPLALGFQRRPPRVGELGGDRGARLRRWARGPRGTRDPGTRRGSPRG